MNPLPLHSVAAELEAGGPSDSLLVFFSAVFVDSVFSAYRAIPASLMTQMWPMSLNASL